MRRDREQMKGVDSDSEYDVFSGLDHLERVQLVNQGELPFAQKPGQFLPKDPIRDKMIIEALRKIDLQGREIAKGQKLDYNQSKALFEIVNRYFEDTDPLMNTERWMAEFVEKKGLTYTDHDGKVYRMKNGMRYLVG